MNFVDSIYESAQKYPKNIAIDFLGNKITYQKLTSLIDQTASALYAIGVREGDIVCIAMPNMPQAILTIYAVNKLGAVVNMIHPLSSETEMLGFLTKMRAKFLLTLDLFYGKIVPIKDKTNLKTIIVASTPDFLTPLKKVGFALTGGKTFKINHTEGVLTWDSFIKAFGRTRIAATQTDRSGEMALILYSGGTTGKTKGVCLSNKNIDASARQMMKANPMLCQSDRFLSVMPIFHGNGLIIGIHVMLMIGARCVLIPRFTPKTYARDLIKNKCNYMSGVPALYERLIAEDIMQTADLSFLKGVFSGADFLSPSLEVKINDFLKAHGSPVLVRQGYGMTEGVVATSLNPVEGTKLGSLGKALDGVWIKIVESGTDNELPVGEVGEIVFSSETNMLGYFEDEDETSNTLRLHKDGKYWIHSGDLGYLDADGFLFFKGRIKRMIVTNGYNVFPSELESIIEGFDMVARACILGTRSSEGTDKIKAFILLADGYEATSSTKEQIMALARKEIAKYALPKEIVFVKEMPKTKISKVDYNALLSGNFEEVTCKD